MYIDETNCKERYNFMFDECLSEITPKTVKEIHQELLAHNFKISESQVRRDLMSQESKKVKGVKDGNNEYKFILIKKTPTLDSTLAGFLYSLYLYDFLPHSVAASKEWQRLLEKIEAEKKKFVKHAIYNTTHAETLMSEVLLKSRNQILKTAANDEPYVTTGLLKTDLQEEFIECQIRNNFSKVA